MAGFTANKYKSDWANFEFRPVSYLSGRLRVEATARSSALSFVLHTYSIALKCWLLGALSLSLSSACRFSASPLEAGMCADCVTSVTGAKGVYEGLCQGPYSIVLGVCEGMC